jgi:hypothetical protein
MNARSEGGAMSTKNGSGEGRPDVAALRAEIKQTRADLGETVQALAAKADVKARAKEQVAHTKERVKAQAAFATGRVRGAAAHATGRVRGASSSTADATGAVGHAVGNSAHAALDNASAAGARVRRDPAPWAAVAVAGAAIVAVLLVIRARRR